jgi:hypothetical protein
MFSTLKFSMLLKTPAEKCVPIHQRANKKSAKEEKEKEITIHKSVESLSHKTYLQKNNNHDSQQLN